MLKRLRPGFWGEIFYLPIRRRRQPNEDITQVSSGVEATTTAAFHDGVQDCAAVPGFGFADEQPIAVSDGGGPDGIFYAEMPIIPRSTAEDITPKLSWSRSLGIMVALLN